MDLPWKMLAPHRPLEGGDQSYVERPGQDGGERLARAVDASPQPLILTGAVGVGKSTELANIDHYLKRHLKRSTALVRLDRAVPNMLKATVDNILENVVGAVAIDRPLRSAAPENQIRELLRDHPETKILVDGLEKATEQVARNTVQTLFELDQRGQFVIVVSYALVKGKSVRDRQWRDASHVLHAVYMDPAKPPTKENSSELLHTTPYHFYYRLAEHRLGSLATLPLAFLALLLRAAFLSGGVPRVFLQLLLGAGTNAVLAGRPLPSDDDLEEAARAQRSSLLHAVRKGDLDALAQTRTNKDAHLEIPFERRLRLLEEGLLLEYQTWDAPPQELAQPARLIYPAFEEREARG